jgi:hypothetical protein
LTQHLGSGGGAATAEAPAPAKTATGKAAPKLPPEEKFWKKYSPHHEFPLSSITSAALHLLVIGLLLLGTWLAVALGLASMKQSPDVTAIALAPGGGGGNPKGVGNGPGQGDPPPPSENVEKTDSREPTPALTLPDLPEGPVDPVRLAEFKDPTTNSRVIVDTNQAVKQMAALDEEARTKVFNALAGKGKAGPGSGGGEGPGKGPNKGPGQGEGKGNISVRQKRVLRWTMIFNTLNGDDYARQLESLGAMIAIPEPNGKQYRLIKDLSKRPAEGKIEDLSTINSIYWVDDKPESVAGLARALMLPYRPGHIVAFFPPKLENKLVELERDFKGLKEEQIFETRFDVVKDGDGYVPKVVSQTPLGKH